MLRPSLVIHCLFVADIETITFILIRRLLANVSQ